MNRPLTRDQVLAWRDRWSYTDKQQIEHSLDVLPEADYYEPESKQYIVARVDGRGALYIAPGYIYWTKPHWAELIDVAQFPAGISGGDEDPGRWFTLSTFQRRGESTPTFEELRAPCPECWTELAASGACSCD